MREDTKLAKIRLAMSEEDWDEALRLAARFRRLGEHDVAIKRAANAMTNPAFYKELKFDLAQIKTEGITALKERYSKSWNAIKEKKPKGSGDKKKP